MIKRCIEIAEGPCHIALRDCQIILKHGSEIERSIPVEDLGVLVVDNPAVTYTHAALCALIENNTAVIVCGGNHHPAGLLLPVEGHTVQAEVISFQASASQRLKDRLWKEIVSAKITNQAMVLGRCGRENAGLKSLSQKVKNGDIENVEGKAAQRYWRLLFGSSFRRDREGLPPNGLLNYGYMVMRAAVARAICSSGLHPSLGLHHKNKYNAFVLADDLMEPLRPLIDIEVYNLIEEGFSIPERVSRARLLAVLTTTVELDGRRFSLMPALQMYTASLRRVFSGEAAWLQIPVFTNQAIQKKEKE